MSTPRLLMLLGDALPVLAIVTETDTRTGKITRTYVRTRRSLALCRRGVHYARKHKPWLIRTITLTSRGKGTLKAFDVATDEKLEPSV